MPGRVWNCNMASALLCRRLACIKASGYFTAWGGASDTGKTCVEIDQQHLHEEGQASHLRIEAGAKLAAGLDFPR